MKTKFLLLAILAAMPAFAQTTAPVAQMPNAVKVCPEGCTITAMPVGTVYQFGIAKTWLAPATSTATSPKFPFSAYYTSFASDPAPGVLKEFDVQKQAKAFVVSYSLNGVTTNLTIPALPAPPPPPVTTTYLVTCTGTGTVASSTTNGITTSSMTISNSTCTAVKQ